MEAETMQRPCFMLHFIGSLSIDSIGHSGSLEKQEFMVFSTFSHYSGCKLKTGTWSTRPENSPPRVCHANESSTVLVSHSRLWGTSVKLKEKWRAFPLAIFMTGDSSILSSSQYSSGLIPKLKSEGKGQLTFQVFSLLTSLVMEGKWPFLHRECGKTIELPLVDGITHVGD